MDLNKTIDINCDLGEGTPNDADLMPFISSCNIACGGHFGTKESIRKTIQLAQEFNVKIGAHPSYPDKENFGRKQLPISSIDLKKSIRKQLEDFLSVCEEEKVIPNHIKLHGTLYNVAAKETPTAETIASLFMQMNLNLPVYTPFNSALARSVANHNSVVPEAFIDRGYENDGSLVSRTKQGALIDQPDLAWEQLKTMYFHKRICTYNGEMIPITAETYCIHGDSSSALSTLQFIHSKLLENGINLSKND